MNVLALHRQDHGAEDGHHHTPEVQGRGRGREDQEQVAQNRLIGLDHSEGVRRVLHTPVGEGEAQTRRERDLIEEALEALGCRAAGEVERKKA